MNYAERADEAQQEQLDWLHQIHEEAQKQTALLARIANHTGLLFGAGLIWIIFVVVGVIAWLAGAFG